MLTPRWDKLKYHAEQDRLWYSPARFRVVPAGRRSGKTELAKRFICKKALQFHRFPDGWFVCLAPTHAQAKRIFWEDLKLLIPKECQIKVSESDLAIILPNHAKLQVLGMDKPERIEGPPVDGAILDEFANMKPTVWTNHLSPALSTINRPGWAWFIGVPEGRNHYYRLYQDALNPIMQQWDGFHWKSAEIIDSDEIENAKSRMDELSFQQEYEASFLNFSGRAYYPFERLVHAKERLTYNPARPLIFCFDFNVSPGTAEILQEQEYKGINPNVSDEGITAGIDEVWIPQNSTTPAICRKLIKDYGDHEGYIYCYGDATGGAKGTAKIAGSDWDLVRAELRQHFGNRVKFRVAKKNPPQRARINALNTRLLSANGKIRFLIDPNKCPHLCDDLDGVILLKGGSGEIDKDHDEWLTHCSDAVGYYFHEKFAVYREKQTFTYVY